MMYDPGTTERIHRANQAETPITLIPKRCACNRAAPAKQLAQHQKCVACQLDDRVATLQLGDIEKLKHALGANSHYPKSKWGWRNYYCAGHGPASQALERLVTAGFASIGYVGDRQTYFHATAAGCKLAGLNPAAVRRAMGGQS